MSIATFIKDNTDDGRNIVRFLIDVMNGDIQGCTLSHRLAAARLLTIYGQNDAPDFIADNTPDRAKSESGRRIWLEIDPGLRTLIKARTDDGRVICMFLIDVMEGRIEGIHVGHRVSAARELLNRAFGKSPSRSLPKSKRSTTPRQSTNGTRRKVASTPEAAAFEARVAERIAAKKAAHSEPTHEPLTNTYDEGPVYRDPDYDPLYIDEKRLQFYEACYDDNFDPYEAAQNSVYAESYTGCPDPECEVHGNPPELDFDPNDFHY